MERKKGITISALVMYLVLLFMFVAIATSVAKRFEINAFEHKALGINMENYSRLSASLNVSANASDNIDVSGTTIIFSRVGMLVDKYTFNASKGQIYKNGSLVVSDVESFNVTKSTTGLVINVKFLKHSVTTERDIYVYI